MKAFAQAIVRGAEGECSQNALVLREQIFDLQRRDLVPTASNYVLGTTNELDVTVAADRRQIAGPEIAIDERGRGLGDVVQVTPHDSRRADLEFADACGQAKLRHLGYAERDAVRRATDRAACDRVVLGP